MLDDVMRFGTELKRTNDLLEKRVSYKRIFVLGIIQGLGSAIGATIVAGILLAIALRFLQQVERLPIVERYVESSAIREQIEYTGR